MKINHSRENNNKHKLIQSVKSGIHFRMKDGYMPWQAAEIFIAELDLHIGEVDWHDGYLYFRLQAVHKESMVKFKIEEDEIYREYEG